MTRATTFATKCFYVVCRDPRMPLVPLSIEDAERMREECDDKWPECGPHEIVRGEPARAKYE